MQSVDACVEPRQPITLSPQNVLDPFATGIDGLAPADLVGLRQRSP